MPSLSSPESPLQPGATLDRYELLCELASGGMATVWLARMRGKRGFEKLYAIKTIKTELSDDPRFEQMFLDEARIASGIQHPNVAQILDLGEQEGVLYLVMEWVDGESLAKVRRFAGKRGHTVPLGVSLRVLADACAGLHAAHELKGDDGENLGIVHRDVSPQNLLIATTGAVKVIDFGVAKASNRLAPTTSSGVVKGKLQYMAPEQALGKPHDRRVDVWAIGATLYELITGDVPYDGETQLEMYKKLVGREPPAPLPEGVPDAVRAIVERTLVHEPEERYPTAAALRRALEDAAKQIGGSSTDDVAAFVEDHLGDRAAKRREMIAGALKQAVVLTSDDAAVSGYEGTVRLVARRDSGVPTRLETPTPIGRASLRTAKQRLEEGAVGETLGAASMPGLEPPRRRGGAAKWIVSVLGSAALVLFAYKSGYIGRGGSPATPSHDVSAAGGGAPITTASAPASASSGSPPSAPIEEFPASTPASLASAVDAGGRRSGGAAHASNAGTASGTSAASAAPGASAASTASGRAAWPGPSTGISIAPPPPSTETPASSSPSEPGGADNPY